jgi:thiamine-phosphate pyrophosphorylase
LRGLYAILDVDFLCAVGVELLPVAEAVLEARPVAVQLRAKSESPRATLDRLRALRPLCAAAHVPLFANDRPDLALLAGCDGVHVGQRDLAVADVRAIAPSLKVGVSTHDPAQLLAALTARPDYVAYGPVFATSSKANPDPVVGLEGLEYASERCREAGIPLVAIGGIDVERARDVARYADQAAVIGALWPGTFSAVRERVLELGRAFG